MEAQVLLHFQDHDMFLMDIASGAVSHFQNEGAHAVVKNVLGTLTELQTLHTVLEVVEGTETIS